eukprot:7290177-Prymnesium_polylepis.1
MSYLGSPASGACSTVVGGRGRWRAARAAWRDCRRDARRAPSREDGRGTADARARAPLVVARKSARGGEESGGLRSRGRRSLLTLRW